MHLKRHLKILDEKNFEQKFCLKSFSSESFFALNVVRRKALDIEENNIPKDVKTFVFSTIVSKTNIDY